MKQFIYIIVTLWICLFISGCFEEKEVHTIPEDDLYDIYYIKEAPEATGNHDLSEVIKVAVVKNEYSQDETIAIDVEKAGYISILALRH